MRILELLEFRNIRIIGILELSEFWNNQNIRIIRIIRIFELSEFWNIGIIRILELSE